MPFDSCRSNVRFRFLSPENCHSAPGHPSHGCLAPISDARGRYSFPKADITSFGSGDRYGPKPDMAALIA
jgi:hypothetical protein